MHRISPPRTVGFNQPRRFDLHPVPTLVGKVHFALHQFHAGPRAQLADLIRKLARRAFTLHKEKLFAPPRTHRVHTIGLWIRLAIDHLPVVDPCRRVSAPHWPHRHPYPFTFHNEGLAVTRRIKALQARAARPLPARHRQPRFLLYRLEPRRRCHLFLLPCPRLTRAESGDLTSTHPLVALGEGERASLIRCAQRGTTRRGRLRREIERRAEPD